MQAIGYRHYIRHPLYLPINYKIVGKKFKNDQEGLDAQTINVSLGGLLFPSKRSIDPKSHIEIKMPFEDKVFNFSAEVVRCSLNAETKLYDIAVKFVKIQEAFKVKMIEQVYLIASYRDLLSLELGKTVSLEEASRKWIDRYSEKFKKLYW